MTNAADGSDSGGNSPFFQSTSVTLSYSSNVVLYNEAGVALKRDR